MKEIWDFGMLHVFLSNTGMTTGRPCLFSSSVCTKHTNYQTFKVQFLPCRVRLFAPLTSSYFPNYLCKILLWDASGPFYTELLRPARVGDVCTLNQHPLDEDAILGGRQDAFDIFLITVSLKKKRKKQIISTKTTQVLLISVRRYQLNNFKNNSVCT